MSDWQTSVIDQNCLNENPVDVRHCSEHATGQMPWLLQLIKATLCCRIYRTGKSGGEESMASDQALAADRVVQALKSFAALLSQPQAQPEFRSLQAIASQACSPCAPGLSRKLIAHCASQIIISGVSNDSQH